MNRAPSFQFYPDKWIAGTMHLDAESYRAYHRVLCWMWLHAQDQCSMPDTDDAWRMATGLNNSVLTRCRVKIMHPDMELLEKGKCKIISHGLRKEARKQKEYRAKQSVNAKTRWHKQVIAKPPHIPPYMPPHMGSSCSPTPTPTPTPTPKDKNKRVPAARFIRPSPQEVTEYAKSKNIELDGGVFCSYYESNGWKVGRNPMQSWKAAVIGTWKRGSGIQGGFGNPGRKSRPPLRDKRQEYESAVWNITQGLREINKTALNDGDKQRAVDGLRDKYRDAPGALKEAMEIVK